MHNSTIVENSKFRSVSRKTMEYRISKLIHNAALECGLIELPSEELCNAHKARRFAHRFGDGCRTDRRMARETYGRYATMTPEQKEEFLKYLTFGMNEAYAADVLKVGWGTYGRTLQADPDFRKQVDGAKQSALGALEHVVYEKGQKGELNAAMAVLNYRQRGDQIRGTRSLERRKLLLKEKEVNAKVKAVDHIVDQAEGKVNFNMLTNDELAEYSRIHELNKSLPMGIELSVEDAVMFARLTRKISNTGSLESAMNGNGAVHALNGISKVDQMMDDDDDED